MELDPPQWTLDPDKFMRSFTSRTKALVLNRSDNFHLFTVETHSLYIYNKWETFITYTMCLFRNSILNPLFQRHTYNI